MSGIPRRAIADGAITPYKLNDAFKTGRYFYADGAVSPQTLGTDGTALATGLDESGAIVNFGNGQPHVGINYIGAQTLLGPRALGGGADKFILSLDQTNNEGVLYTWDPYPTGYVGYAGGPLSYTVGTSPSMFIRASVSVVTVASIGELAVGFVKPYSAAATDLPDDATDIACLNAQAGTVNIETVLNDAATETTDTGQTVADATVFELKVILDNKLGAGRPRFFLNSTEFYPTTQFAFDSGDVLIPFLLIRSGAAATSIVYGHEIEVGLLEDVDDYLSW